MQGVPAKVLFPLQLGPDVVANVSVAAAVPVLALVADDSRWDTFSVFAWPLLPLFAPIVGVVDAWNGRGFWQPTMVPFARLHPDDDKSRLMRRPLRHAPLPAPDHSHRER